MARGCRLRKMYGMGLSECLVRWTDSFTRDRRVIMSVDGQGGGEYVDVPPTGLANLAGTLRYLHYQHTRGGGEIGRKPPLRTMPTELHRAPTSAM